MSIRELIDPQNSALIFIDHQPQMSFGVANIDRQTLKNGHILQARLLSQAGAFMSSSLKYESSMVSSFQVQL